MSANPVLALVVAATALSQAATAGVAYSNLGPGGRHDHQYRYGSDFIFPNRAELAWQFTASESGTLNAAKLGLYRTANAPVVLTLYADTGTEPGAVLASWTFTPPTYGFSAIAKEMSIVDGPRLEAGSSYYIAVRAGATPRVGWEWYVALRAGNGSGPRFPVTRMGQRPGTGGVWDMYAPDPVTGSGAYPSFEFTVDPCGTSDFNGDGDFGTDADIESFFACLGGDCCATCFAGGSDFNGDGDVGTDADIEAFFRVLGGGTC